MATEDWTKPLPGDIHLYLKDGKHTLSIQDRNLEDIPAEVLKEWLVSASRIGEPYGLMIGYGPDGDPWLRDKKG